MCYPVSAVGTHVSACPNHQVKRTTPLETRGNVALAGTFGYELDLTKLTDEEKETVRKQCEDYHKYFDVIHNGNLYRLISSWKDRAKCAWMYVSDDKNEALVTYVVIRYGIFQRNYLRLSGLDPNKRYLNEQTGQILSGRTLMNAGMNIRDILKDYESRTYRLIAVD